MTINGTQTQGKNPALKQANSIKRVLARLFLPVLFALGLASVSLASRADDTLQAKPSNSGATDFLKQSMSHYQALTSLKAQCGWNETFGGVPEANVHHRSNDTHQEADGRKEADVRTILYVKPNQFKVISAHSDARFVQTSVSDGKRLVEYSNQASLPAMNYPAPVTIAQVSSMQMQHPMFCGSLLYQFFGGPANLGKLADTGKMPITFGAEATVAGEPCRTVRFYAQGLYGVTEIAISPRDFLIRRITYDSAPLMAMMAMQSKTSQFKKMLNQKMPNGQKAAMPKIVMPTSSRTTEEYRQIVVDQPIMPDAFDTAVPKGRSVTDMNQAEAGTPPVPQGSLAPDFQVTSLSSKQPVKLSALRGRVVLLDFWATWCPPCRKSLPETQKLASTFGAKGLAVMTISDEGQPTIAAFLKSNRYTFPAYRDGEGSASKAYKITAIPTLAIIDREGHLIAYLVGLQEPATVLDALKKAGLQVP